MTTMKCDQTGHFFGYYPEHDIGFTCFECLEEFGPSGRRPANPWGYSVGMTRDSRKRRSLHLPPPPPQEVPQEPVSERDERGRRRSKPWRCLQQRCKLLACDRCAEQLTNPEYVSLAKDRDLSELQGKRNSIVGAEMLVRAGAATPPDQRGSRELRSSTQEQLAPAAVPASESDSGIFVALAGGNLESDSTEWEEGESALDDLRTKLVYRRAGHVSTSALAQYHHQSNRPGRPSIPNRQAMKDQPPPREEGRRPATVIPEHLISTTGPKNQMVTLEVDSNEGSDDEEDFVPKLAVRSATQAANQAMRSVHWRQRAAGMAAVPRVERI